MPIIKGIPCHTPSSRKSVMYAAGEENPKVVACDHINCCPLDSMGRNVWQQFDGLREDRGLNKPRMRVKRDAEGNPVLDEAGNPVMYDSTVYYEHYIISPDPKNSPTLGQVRSVATEWASKTFADFQVVIGYHNDTGIIHAHVLVNSPSVVDGSRVTDVTRGAGWGRRAWRDLQDIARSHGLSGFRDEVAERSERLGRDVGETDVLAKDARSAPERTKEPNRPDERSKAVASLYASGRYSWVEDIRCRLEVAALISCDVGQYREECARMGVVVGSTADGRDWKYALARQPSRQVSGRRLGSAWTESGVGRRLARDGSSGAAKPKGESLEALERALEALMGAGARQVRLLDAEERRRLEEREWRLVRGTRSLLSRATGPMPGCPLERTELFDAQAAGALAALREAGWPVEGVPPFEMPATAKRAPVPLPRSRAGAPAAGSPSHGAGGTGKAREGSRGAGRSM